MNRVFLYNIAGEERLLKLRLAAYRLGLECAEVKKEDFSKPIGSLLGEPGYGETEPTENGTFSGEMLLMEQMNAPFLDEIRVLGVGIGLKAVVTENNRGWSSERLYRELLREQESLRSLSVRRAPRREKKKKKK